jgi:hypothetical protein
VILWALLFLAAGHLALDVVIGRWRPDWGDPQYGRRYVNLRRRMAEAPGRPVVLMLGSSRAGSAFSPEALAAGRGSEHLPLMYNMAATGSGPFKELLCLRRLLAQGVRPHAVVIEVLPVLLSTEGENLRGKDYVDGPSLRWSDLDLFRRYSPALARDRYEQWLECSCSPWHSYRLNLVARYAPGWMTPARAKDGTFWKQMIGPFGWVRLPDRAPPDAYERALRQVHDAYAPHLDFDRIDPVPDRALRELLGLCRREGIRVAAVVTLPESSVFRGWYGPNTRRVVNDYLDRLCQEYGTRFVDASGWLPDEEFQDAHHLLPSGAVAFTARLWDTALEPSLRDGGDLPAGALRQR